MEVVSACEGLVIESAWNLKVEPADRVLVRRLLTVRVLGAEMVQVGVVDTLVPVALKHVCVEDASEY